MLRVQHLVGTELHCALSTCAVHPTVVILNLLVFCQVLSACSVGDKGQVTVSGVICPFPYATFRLKRVNNEKIWLLPHGFLLHPWNTKDTSLYWQKSAYLYGHISLNSMTLPCKFMSFQADCQQTRVADCLLTTNKHIRRQDLTVSRN